MPATYKKTRLIRKTSKTFLLISFVLMMVSTVVLFFYVRNLLREEIEEELRSTEARIESALSSKADMYQLPPVVEIANVAELGVEKLQDTIIYDPSQDEMEEFRELITYSVISGTNYRITVRTLIVESEDILIAVVISYLVIILLVFVFLFYLNKARNQQLWQPFFTSLEQMKQFSLSSEEPMALPQSDILEFSELNTEITTLVEKVRSDYKNLKQFTEDVSHELQTPLAVIQAKIENIINENHLNQIQFNHLTSIQGDIQRLTQLNKRLTLLTKIENNQFVNVEKIDIAEHIGETIQNFQEISSTKIDFIEREKIQVQMDSYLAEILCNNLISNAIKYSPQAGKIEIRTKGKMLSISNYGKKPLKYPERLYSRFYRESETAKSTGLGLAIVNRICELYHFEVKYHFETGQHIFSIKFQ